MTDAKVHNQHRVVRRCLIFVMLVVLVLIGGTWVILRQTTPVRTAIAVSAQTVNPAKSLAYLAAPVRPCILAPRNPVISGHVSRTLDRFAAHGLIIAPTVTRLSVTECLSDSNLVIRGWSGRVDDLDIVKKDGETLADYFGASGVARSALEAIENTRAFYKRILPPHGRRIAYVAVSQQRELPHPLRDQAEAALVTQELLQALSGLNDVTVQQRTPSMIAEWVDPAVLHALHDMRAMPREERLWKLRELETKNFAQSGTRNPVRLCLADEIILQAVTDLNGREISRSMFRSRLEVRGPTLYLRVLFMRWRDGQPLFRNCYTEQ